MSKPYIHSISSAKRFGGKPEDYLEIHNLLDSSKAALADNRHRFLTHNSWFIGFVLEKIFGTTLTNSDGKVVSVRDVGEQHVLEDYGGAVYSYSTGFPTGYALCRLDAKWSGSSPK